MYRAAPQMPEGRLPVCIQSRFMLATRRSAVPVTSARFSRTPRRSAKRCRYRLGSTGLAGAARMLCLAVSNFSMQGRSLAQGRAATQPVRDPSAGTSHADSGSPGEHGLLLQSQQLAELEEDVPQHEDIDLERV